MSEAGTAVLTKPERKPGIPDGGQKRVTELRVTGHLMTLETGVFCVFQAPGSSLGKDESGLPGVRISLPPGLAGNPDAVSISTFRADGWLSGRDAAALVRVSDGPAQVLVTVYQSTGQGAEAAPRLQVLRLSHEAAANAPARTNGVDTGVETPDQPAIIAHVQRTGDIGAKIGDWLGARGSKRWIEGFTVVPPHGIAAEDIEYQAVLGRGWNSPWMEGGKFCGSRGMALPLLGLRLRLKGDAAKTFRLRYSASFVDGTEIGPVEAGEPCETDELAALEAIQLLLEPRAAAEKQSVGVPSARVPVAKPPLAKPPVAKRRAAPPPGKPSPASKPTKPRAAAPSRRGR